MIRVNIVRNAQTRLIQQFTVDGHANYDKSGKDIVCAGVSAVTVGTVNAIEDLLKVPLELIVKKGLLQAALPNIEETGKAEKVQLLLEAMVVMLTSIKKTYTRYLTINEILE
ncbi:MAG TPA: ribosomal-processing cysteine protease Prp [Bacilli bacterium]